MSVNLMVRVNLSANLMASVILSENLTVSIRLSGNFMVNFSASVYLTMTLSVCNNNNRNWLGAYPAPPSAEHT